MCQNRSAQFDELMAVCDDLEQQIEVQTNTAKRFLEAALRGKEASVLGCADDGARFSDGAVNQRNESRRKMRFEHRPECPNIRFGRFLLSIGRERNHVSRRAPGSLEVFRITQPGLRISKRDKSTL